MLYVPTKLKANFDPQLSIPKLMETRMFGPPQKLISKQIFTEVNKRDKRIGNIKVHFVHSMNHIWRSIKNPYLLKTRRLTGKMKASNTSNR